MDRPAPEASSTSPEPGGSRIVLLSRIADLVGCEVDDFKRGAALGDDAADASELLRLWLDIPDPDDRRKVLALARELAPS